MEVRETTLTLAVAARLEPHGGQTHRRVPRTLDAAVAH
jgi:hypothetical protein